MHGSARTNNDVAFFDTVADAMPAMMCALDTRLECVWANRRFLDFRGSTLDQELGIGWRDGVHPDDLPAFVQALEDCLDRRAPFEIRYRLRHASGQYRWLQHRGAPHFAQDGVLLGSVATCLDVDDVVLAEHEHQQFFNIASDILLTANADGYVGKINSAAERVLGWTAEEIVRTPIAELLHPDDAPATYALRDRLRNGEEINGFENRYRHKDGSWRWLSWRTRYDPVTGQIFGCAVDVTDRKLYQHDLEESLKRYDLAISATSEGLWDYDLASGALQVSPRYREMLGWQANEGPTTRDAWVAQIHPDDVASAIQAQKDYIDGVSADYRIVFRMRHKDGGWRILLSRAAALRDEAGRAYRLIGIHTDITEQREQEDHLRLLKEQAEAANRAKTDFLANMSHEIRTPMNAVIGAAQILSLGTLSDEKQRKVLGVLTQGANSLMELINDLLDVAKIEARALELDRAPFDARELMADVVRMLELQAAAKGLEIQQQSRCACVAERPFIGDKGRIRQIMMTLCANAVKFTQAGAITVGIECQPIDADKEELRLWVSDTGIGVPQDKLDAIFGTFEQGDSTVSRRYGGSGLGLSIAKSLTEVMGGTITATSEVGIGSTFSVRLPLDRAPVATDTTAEGPGDDTTVLLVEDTPSNVIIAGHFLEQFGYRYEVAETGADALSRIRAGARYQAVLMDIQMPGMDGRETTRRIRAFERETGQPPLPIIAMTAHAMLSDRDACLAAGMDDYISKPFDPQVLAAKLKGLTRPRLAKA